MQGTETLTETQVRLILEEQCAKLFRVVLAPLPKDTMLTLLLVDYGEADEPFKNTAYSTSLAKGDLITMVEALVQRWKCGSKSVVLHNRKQHGWIPAGPWLRGLGDLMKEYMPAGVGFALLFGTGPACQYLATIDREAMTALFENELLPAWRSEIKTHG